MPIHTRRVSCFVLVCLWSTVWLKGSGQTPQEKPAIPQIRVQTGEVVVDVSVTDGDGKPGKYELRLTLTDAGRSASATARFRVER